MITKERLEELIEQGATIWTDVYRGSHFKIKLTKHFVAKLGDSFDLYGYGCDYFGIPLNHLYETERDAEWHKEFGGIERTERLELPTWEEAIDLVYSGSFGVQTIIKFDKCKFGYKLQLDGNVYIFVDKGTDTLFMGSLTKENYTIACRKCVELFLGEKK